MCASVQDRICEALSGQRICLAALLMVVFSALRLEAPIRRCDAGDPRVAHLS
jgi:hypothetical protein